MRKYQELGDPHSCLQRAENDEMLFVLLGRDAAAPTAIRAWIKERLRLRKNHSGDEQIEEAELCARTMEVQCEEHLQAKARKGRK